MVQQNKKHDPKFSSKRTVRERTQGKGGAPARVKLQVRNAVKGNLGGNEQGSKQRRKQQQEALRQKKKQTVLEERRLGTAQGAPKIVGVLGLAENADPFMVCEHLAANASAPVSAGGSHHKAEADWAGKHEGFRQGRTYHYPQHKQRATLLAAGVDLDRQLDIAKVADVVVLVVRVSTDTLTFGSSSQPGSRAPSEMAEDVDMADVDDTAAGGTLDTADLDDDEVPAPHRLKGCEALQARVARMEDGGEDDRRSVVSGASTCSTTNYLGMCVDEIGQRFLNILINFGLPSVVIALQGLNQVPKEKHRKKLERLHQRYFASLFVEAPVMALDTPQDSQALLRFLATKRLRRVHWREESPYFVIDGCRWETSEETGEEELLVSGYLRGKPMTANGLVHLCYFGSFQMSAVYADRDPCAMSYEQAKRQPQLIERSEDGKREPLDWCKEPDPTENEQTWPTADDVEGGDASCPIVPRAADDDQQTEATKTYAQTQIESLMATDIRKLENMTEEERRAELERMEEERKARRAEAEDDEEWPDEVNTPIHIPARQRFLRYRGLASLRASKWDPYESLPLDYGRIFQFENFLRTKKRVWSLFPAFPVKPDQYVTVALRGVPRQEFDEVAARFMQARGFLTACGLRQHENKFSVVNLLLQHNKDYGQPIKSKDRVLIHVGFRVFNANPIFSEFAHKGDKFKFLRYFHPREKFAVATLYAPITYPPCPVLVFRHPVPGQPCADLMAFGSVMSVDPLRLSLKRVVLTGHLYKVHKRQSVVRWMFHTPEDVNYFKPVGVYVKRGLHGHITQSLGTHGYMKVVFSGPVQGGDVVCMDLWKRVYPKWTTSVHSLLPSVLSLYDMRSLEDIRANAVVDEIGPDDAVAE